MFTKIVCFVVRRLWFHPWVQGPFSLLWQAVVSLCVITPLVFNILGVKYFGKGDTTYGFYLLISFFGGVFFFIAVIAVLLRIARLVARQKFEKVSSIKYRPPFKEGEYDEVKRATIKKLIKLAMEVDDYDPPATLPQSLRKKEILKRKKAFRETLMLARAVVSEHLPVKIRDYVKLAETFSLTSGNNKFEEEEDTGWVVAKGGWPK